MHPPPPSKIARRRDAWWSGKTARVGITGASAAASLGIIAHASGAARRWLAEPHDKQTRRGSVIDPGRETEAHTAVS